MPESDLLQSCVYHRNVMKALNSGRGKMFIPLQKLQVVNFIKGLTLNPGI